MFRNLMVIAAFSTALGITVPAVAQSNQLISKDSVTGEEFANNSFDPSLSSDGRYTAFASYADVLGTGRDTTFSEIYVYDRNTDSYEHLQIKTKSGNFHAPYISGNGRYVLIRYSTNPTITRYFERLYVYDRETDAVELLRIDLTQDDQFSLEFGRFSMTDNGGYIVFTSSNNFDPKDTNGVQDIYAFRRSDQKFRRISVAPDKSQFTGQSTVGKMTGNGRNIIFVNENRDLYLFEVSTRRTRLITPDLSAISEDVIIIDLDISDDGNVVALQLYDRVDDADIIVWHDLLNLETKIAYQPSITHGRPQSFMSGVNLSGDGQYLIYTVHVPRLISFTYEGGFEYEGGIKEAVTSIYDSATEENRRLTSVANPLGLYGGEFRYEPAISHDGSTIGFTHLSPQPDGQLTSQIYIGNAVVSTNAPVADAGADAAVSSVVLETELDGSGSSDDITPSVNLGYRWDFVDSRQAQTDWYQSPITNPQLDDASARKPLMSNIPDFSLIRLVVQDGDGLFSEPDYMTIRREDVAE